MKEKKTLFINIAAQIIAFLVQFIISFFLTPFIVEKIGTSAYGFIGLANNFVLYAQLLTVALNSMAGRFIAIEYHKGNIDEARKYFSSVFIANTIISVVLLLLGGICIIFLDTFINIPRELVLDVKWLFVLIIANFIISIIFSTYQVATFIKNRLDLNAIRNLIGNILRMLIICGTFYYWKPHLWFIGFSSLICGIYVAFYNLIYTKKLTPDLYVDTHLGEYAKVKTLIGAGAWNTITKLGNILSHGFDLLFANLFIGSLAMGVFSITKQIPVIIVGLVNTICSSFAPSLTKQFAQNNMIQLKKDLTFSIKLSGFISVIPMTFIFVFSDVFYALWLPNENAEYLYKLTILGTFALPIGMALEGVQNIFTVMNKVKVYSLYSLCFSILIILTLLGIIHFVPISYRLYFMAFVSSFYGLCRVGIFLPIYASKCIEEKMLYFFPPIFRVIITLLIAVVVMSFFKELTLFFEWKNLLIFGIYTVLIVCIIGYYIIFEQQDRQNIVAILKRKYRNDK